jgi:hypothetical protein
MGNSLLFWNRPSTARIVNVGPNGFTIPTDRMF